MVLEVHGWVVEEVWEMLRRRNNSKEMKSSQPWVRTGGREGEHWDGVGGKFCHFIEPFTWVHGMLGFRTQTCEPHSVSGISL